MLSCSKLQSREYGQDHGARCTVWFLLLVGLLTWTASDKLTNWTSDAPYPLILAALQAVPVVTGTEEDGFNFTIYTGDLVSHDPDNELSRYAVTFHSQAST